VGGVSTGSGPSVVSRVSATVRGLGAGGRVNAAELAVVDWGGKLDTAAAGLKLNDAASVTASVAERTTVLPRRKKMPAAEADLEPTQRLRFERVRLLGQGAMGQVELARDNDIRRTVAVKRMIGDTISAEALMRFADEIRVVGQLEHPGIVPIYDVGRDANGDVYLVMKHLEGESMEEVIDKLKAGDPDYCERFPVEYRVHLFLQVLDAVRYAHARGILHRDLKPANIQIGPFGEVTVMDWGIAKPFSPAQQSNDVQLLDKTLLESQGRLLETQFGSLAGTPLYMSPEQAAGRNDVRLRITGSLGLAQYLGAGFAAHLRNGMYGDSWGVGAWMPEAAIVKELGPRVVADIHGRWYAQTGATFYQRHYDTLKENLTADILERAERARRRSVHQRRAAAPQPSRWRALHRSHLRAVMAGLPRARVGSRG